jgi:hypothetical protein
MVLTITSCSPVTGLFCHRRLADHPPNLTPASGRQDHTTSPSANDRRSSSDTAASIASRSTFVTTRTPLVAAGRREQYTISDFPKGESQIWTAQISMIPLTKLAFMRTRLRAVFDRMRDVNSEKSIKLSRPTGRISCRHRSPPGSELPRQRLHPGAAVLSISRAMMSCWISLVPSKIRKARECRNSRSTTAPLSTPTPPNTCNA